MTSDIENERPRPRSQHELPRDWGSASVASLAASSQSGGTRSRFKFMKIMKIILAINNRTSQPDSRCLLVFGVERIYHILKYSNIWNPVILSAQHTQSDSTVKEIKFYSFYLFLLKKHYWLILSHCHLIPFYLHSGGKAKFSRKPILKTIGARVFCC